MLVYVDIHWQNELINQYFLLDNVEYVKLDIL